MIVNKVDKIIHGHKVYYSKMLKRIIFTFIKGVNK